MLRVVRVRVRRVLGLRARRAGSALWEGRVAGVVAPVPPGMFFQPLNRCGERNGLPDHIVPLSVSESVGVRV